MALAIPAPSSRMTDHNLRFSDVAQFVGLSLLRDPSEPRSKAKQRPKLTNSIQSGSGEYSYSQSYSSLPSPAASRELSQRRSVHSESAPTLPQVSSDRADQLKIQLGYMKAEQQAEQLMLKKMEAVLSGSLLAERRVHERVEKERERRDFHKEKARKQEETIHALQEELRAAMQPPPVVKRGSILKSEPTISPQESRELPPKPAAVQESRVEVMHKAQPVHVEHHKPRKSHDDQTMRELNTKVSDEPVSKSISKEAEEWAHVTNVANLSHASSSSSTGQGIMKKSKSEEDVQQIDWSSFETEEERDNHRRDVIRQEMMKRCGNALEAFARINLNGSGRICSQEFADGVARMGVPWQQLTGLNRPRHLFKLFDCNPTNGVITLYELFPTERNKRRDDSGMSTPDFWKKWIHKNRGMHQDCRGAKWQPDGPEGELALLFDNRVKNEQSAFEHKKMSATFRRMKARGKSDARCREMLALHLPKGSGPADRQEVKTFSQLEVKKCKRAYNDAVLESQRKSQKALYALKDQRRVISNAKAKLYSVALEPLVRQKNQEKVAQELQGGGMSLGLHKRVGKSDHVESTEEPIFEKPVDASEGQLSFKGLAKLTAMDVKIIEDVFTVWMKHSDKSETIHKRHFDRLLQDLKPQLTFAESDLELWWDQVHDRGEAAQLSVNWQAHHPELSSEVDPNDPEKEKDKIVSDKEKERIARELQQIRKSPATFDQFIIWWSKCEVSGYGEWRNAMSAELHKSMSSLFVPAKF